VGRGLVHPAGVAGAHRSSVVWLLSYRIATMSSRASDICNQIEMTFATSWARLFLFRAIHDIVGQDEREVVPRG
jgi:hypothetical protein